MAIGLLILKILAYSLALWLGLYLLARNPASSRLRWAGFGLIAYALSLASDLLIAYAATPELALNLARLHGSLLIFPALFWLGAMIQLLPQESPFRRLLDRLWRFGFLPAAILFYLFGAGSTWVFDFTHNPPQPGPIYPVFAVAVLLPMLLTLLLIGHTFWQLTRSQAALNASEFTRIPLNSLGALLMAALFFTLGAGLLIFPLDWLSRSWVLIAIGLDLILLGVVVARLDAFAEGEALLPDFFRSLDYSAAVVLLFGGLVGLAIVGGTGLNFAMLLLLLAIIAAAIITQVFGDLFQAVLDSLVFARFPQLRQARADLRATASALPRLSEIDDFEALDEAEFTRLTRRALSHLGDLPRLAVNPLTYLPLVEARLAARNTPANTLERAAELKSLLAESIARLKPRDQGDFGTSEAWRYYNALYFPYVVGLKPYSRRSNYHSNGLDPVTREALEWFQAQVPERTLHNWQNAATKLIAQNLREELNGF